MQFVGAARIGFAGTPEFAADILAGLLAAGMPIVHVLSQPDRPKGRKRRLEPTPVKAAATAAGIPVSQPTRLKTDNPLADLDLDLLIVVAYGRIVPEPMLATPRRGCVNLHASLLPRWRGAAPVEHALLAGDAETGVALMQMDAGLDTGPVFALRRCEIAADETRTRLFATLTRLAIELCVEHVPALLAGTLTATPQSATGVTWAPKIDASLAAVDWRLDAITLDRRARALDGRGGIHTSLKGARLKLLEVDPQPGGADGAAEPGTILAADRTGIRVVCGPEARDALRIRTLQLARGKGTVLTAAQALNGFGELFAPGIRIGD